MTTTRTQSDSHDWYNTGRYPILIAVDSHGMWDIYGNSEGNLAAIAVEPGRLSSHFGDKYHVRNLIRSGSFAHRELTLAGVDLIGKDWLEKFTETPV